MGMSDSFKNLIAKAEKAAVEHKDRRTRRSRRPRSWRTNARKASTTTRSTS